jgi:protein TilB
MLEPKIKKEPLLFGPDGRVYQKNEGKWSFKWEEAKDLITLRIEISKFLDTSAIEVQVFATYVRVTIKGKFLQLLFPEEVCAKEFKCERSRLTGQLAITVPKLASMCKVGDISVAKAKVNERFTEPKKTAAKKINRYQHIFDPSEAVNIRNILSKPTRKDEIVVGNIVEKQKIEQFVPVEEFIDDPDVPPLC